MIFAPLWLGFYIIIQIGKAIRTNGSQFEWVNLGNLSAACMTHPDACTYGGTMSLWINVYDKPTHPIFSAYSNHKTGFIIFALNERMWVDLYLEFLSMLDLNIYTLIF